MEIINFFVRGFLMAHPISEASPADNLNYLTLSQPNFGQWYRTWLQWVTHRGLAGVDASRVPSGATVIPSSSSSSIISGRPAASPCSFSFSPSLPPDGSPDLPFLPAAGPSSPRFLSWATTSSSSSGRRSRWRPAAAFTPSVKTHNTTKT